MSIGEDLCITILDYFFVFSLHMRDISLKPKTIEHKIKKYTLIKCKDVKKKKRERERERERKKE